jgi:hypothetical protein
MAHPPQSVTLSSEQIAELNKKLSNLRHDVNNNLSLIIAAAEIIRLRPGSSEQMWNGLAEKPHKIAEAMAQFSREFERTLGIKR